MKKIISVLLAFAMVFSLAAFALAREEEKYPIIIVPGYSSSALYKEGEDGSRIHVWNVEVDKIVKALIINAAEIGIDIGAWAKGDAKLLADTVGREFKDMFIDMAFDEEGKPTTPLYTYHSSAKETNTKWLNENEGGLYVHEIEIMPYVSQYLGEKAEEWTFNFHTDFRRNEEECAADLDAYIDDVLNYTGAKKVNILAVSHGGQVSATYLSLYGGKKVNNAVLTVPAIGGALLAYDIMADKIEFDEETLLYFIENGMMLEEDYNWLVKAQELGFLDELLHYLRPYILDVLGNWGSIWDFIPSEYFDEVSAFASDEFLRSETYAKSVKFHNELLPKLPVNLKKAENDGAKIYLIAGSSWPSVVGSKVNSDAIISVNSSTGATCAPYNMRFADGYEALYTVCSDKSHNHISPAMDIDASSCYLPETTWFVRGLFHGMTLKDENYTRYLMKMLVESDERVNINTYPEYPQFHDCMNTCESVYAEFDNSKTGFVCDSDTAIKITNLSNKSSITVFSVSAENTDISFVLSDYIGKTIKPGETLSVRFRGELPKKSFTVAQIKISYGIGLLTPLGEKDFYFTLMNGEKPEYDINNPYVPLGKESGFTSHIEGSAVLGIFNKLGLTHIFEIVYNIVYNLIGKYVTGLIG